MKSNIKRMYWALSLPVLNNMFTDRVQRQGKELAQHGQNVFQHTTGRLISVRKQSGHAKVGYKFKPYANSLHAF